MKTTRYFGCHVSAAGGLPNAVANGIRLNVNAIQIHATPPQRWNAKPFDPAVGKAFTAARKQSDIAKVFFHGVYLINLAAADRSKVNLAVLSLTHYLELMDEISGDGVIFHVGSNRDQETEEAGLRQAAETINRILSKSKGSSPLLLEVAAGSGKIIGDRMEELRGIYDQLENKQRVGFALDTQHLWASGYDIVDKLEDFVVQADAVLGLAKIRAIHINDSKTALGSRADRHENLGQGQIGLAALKRFVNHPRLRPIPMVLETPGLKDPETAAEEVEKLRSIIE